MRALALLLTLLLMGAAAAPTRQWPGTRHLPYVPTPTYRLPHREFCGRFADTRRQLRHCMSVPERSYK